MVTDAPRRDPESHPGGTASARGSIRGCEDVLDHEVDVAGEAAVGAGDAAERVEVDLELLALLGKGIALLAPAAARRRRPSTRRSAGARTGPSPGAGGVARPAPARRTRCLGPTLGAGAGGAGQAATHARPRKRPTSANARPASAPISRPSARFRAGFGDTALVGRGRGLPHRRRRLRGKAVVEEDGRDLGDLLRGAARLLLARRLDLDPHERAALLGVDVERSSSSCGVSSRPRFRIADSATARLSKSSAAASAASREPGVAAGRLPLADEHDRRVGTVGRVLEERDGEPR